jgi:two-component system, chemotaxis family, chemotaxis protein CheY
MDKLNIIYVDDQREVLSTLSKDLEIFEKYVTVEECESAREAIDLINEIDAAGDYIAVIISDHIMPGISGVDFLTKITVDGRFDRTKKMLLTGQANHQDTIQAINHARIEKYIEKPWKSEELVEAVKILLTHFIIDAGIDYENYTPVLHQPTLLNYLQHKV